jgi:thymidylate synthase ThyX
MTQKAKIIKDSINSQGQRITTFELDYWRPIHAEVLTHRIFSRNSQSSRAVPVEKVIEQVRNNPASPSHWGKKQKGMQADEQLTGEVLQRAKDLWMLAAKDAADTAERMLATGGHKQWVNRVLEPFQTMKVIVTSTDFNNFLWLRNHKDAQPEMRELAEPMQQEMQQELEASKPDLLLHDNMWHLPYVETTIIDGKQRYYDDTTNKEITLDQAIKISCSSCAQVSYRKLDTSLEKAEDLYNRLVASEPVHASAFEHVAKTCGLFKDWDSGWNEGITHVNRDGHWFSGNFKHWVQYRQLIPNNSKAYTSNQLVT